MVGVSSKKLCRILVNTWRNFIIPGIFLILRILGWCKSALQAFGGSVNAGVYIQVQGFRV